MRVLLLHNRYQQPGGEDNVVEVELRMLNAAGHRASVYQRHNDDLRDAGPFTRIASGLKTVWAWDTHRELAALLRREKPDVAHFHNTFPLISPAAYFACRDVGVPVIQTLHNFRLLCPAAVFFRDGHVCEDCLHGGLSRSVIHACYRGSRTATAATAAMLSIHRAFRTWTKAVDSYIALTDFARRKFIAGGIPETKITVKPNCLRDDPGVKDRVKDRAGDYALFVGRLTAEKGVETLVSAWKGVEDIPLMIVGDGPLRPQLETAASGHANIVFRGRLSGADTVAAIKGARFLVFPSEWYECFPMTVIESFACGTPILFSAMESLQEIITPGRTGVSFRPGDPADLAERARWAWAHPDDLAEMGRAARAEFESKYTAARNSLMLAEIYRRALRTHLTPPWLPLTHSASPST